MKKEEMKVKVKEFAQKYEKGLKIAGGAGLVILGSVVGWKACMSASGLKYGDAIIHNKDIVGLLADARGKYPHNTNVVLANLEEPLKMADLGSLGKQMMEEGCVDANGLTHFIMFGKGLDK